ncbi:MAG: hypothetical protein M1831_003349 [Alyxoria varia]|nr:MAG: hypothetical protein M1831_003349 [Alyxoria varia]
MRPPTSSPDKATNGRKGNETPETSQQPPKALPTPQKKEKTIGTSQPQHEGLKDYQLGDCLGKGAFGSVYRALNWRTGETVAVKKIKLTDLPKSELRVIMLEIDLLKNLNHPNIVKYQGFVKSSESLCIILEYCENGSLHSICKNFGKFPESLVALYMSRVLNGLLYLHEQGVIHRDIKGANILTTKEGLVKLADFGVATKASGLHEASVVGTPYWMAPEVIELSGATTASDVWSLGCTVIELLEGKPPYHKFQPMQALFRIVNDDHPPLPESCSPAVQDFLMQCFQKDPNLRVSAKKLLKHPWIANAKKADSVIPTNPTKYDEAVWSIQQWNERLKSPNGDAVSRQSREGSESPVPNGVASPAITTLGTSTFLGASDLVVPKQRLNPDAYKSPEPNETDNWDDDFASSITSSALKLPHLKNIDENGRKLSTGKLRSCATSESATSDQSLKERNSKHTSRRQSKASQPDPLETVRPSSPAKTKASRPKTPQATKVSQKLHSQPKTQILRTPLKASRAPRPQGPKRSSSVFREDPDEDYSDLIAKDDVALDQKFHQVLRAKQNEAHSPKFTHMSDLKNSPRSIKGSKAGGSARNGRQPSSGQQGARKSSMRRVRSSVEISKYAEKVEDEDFSDVFGNDATVLTKAESESGSERGIMSMLNSKFSSNSWLGDEEDEDDPFAQLEENLDEMDMDTKVARDKHVRMCTLVESLIGSLKTSQPEDILADISEQLMQVLFESPDMKSVIISSHGLLPILEVLENCQDRDIILQLLKIINIIILDSVEIQENFCFVGGIPIVTKFAHKKYSSEIRLEAAAFVRQMYQTSTLTLQMFISCGGLNVLVEFLEEDYDAEKDLVLIGVNGVWSVFELQGPTPKNDFCRIFSRSQVLYPLSLVLNRVLEEEGELAELVQGRIVNIFFIFSQAENHVKESVADRMVLKRVLKDLRRMSPNHQITMLKFIKNLSMLATTLDPLQNSNAIEVLTDLLSSNMKYPHFREISNQVLNIMFNLCRLSKTRQEDAALNGVIPLLQRIVKTERPLKEFALPILCDMAHSGKVGRKILWQNKGLDFYISLLADPYWQVTALDAIFIWLQEETAKVEENLIDCQFSNAIIDCFTNSKADSFENLLEPLQKLLRLSPPVASTLAHPDLFFRTVQKLNNKKAVVRGNLLRIIRSICDASEDQGALIRRYGLYEAIERLAEGDPAVLVRNMASDLVRSNEASTPIALDGGRYRISRRTSSSTATPPALVSSSSQPSTPRHSRASTAAQSTYYDGSEDHKPFRPRTSHVNGTAYRPVSRDGNKGLPNGSGTSATESAGGSTSGAKTRVSRPPRVSRVGYTTRNAENIPLSSAQCPPPTLLPRPGGFGNPRRRRQTSGN